MIFIYAPVRQDHDVHTVPVSSVHLYEQSVNSTLKARILIIGDRYHFCLKAFLIYILDLHQIGIGQDRIAYLHHVAVLRGFLQDISVGSHVNSC